MSDTIPTTFANYFANWNITLPPDAVATRSRGELRQTGWFIRYQWHEENNDLCLDFYASHRMTNDRHVRIHRDGMLEHLPAYQDMMVHNPAIPGDKERAQREYDEYNRRVAEELREKGWS
ncbi:MAG: hypothetical protein CYG59_11355 [Chloroflexi bacterium]|nr:MAG: hypothetical protein CYG59_11355 [Chloroflexota bacterium]